MKKHILGILLILTAIGANAQSETQASSYETWAERVRVGFLTSDAQYQAKRARAAGYKPPRPANPAVQVNPLQEAPIEITSDLKTTLFSVSSQVANSPAGMKYLSYIFQTINEKSFFFSFDNLRIVAYDAARGDLRSRALIMTVVRDALQEKTGEPLTTTEEKDFALLQEATEKTVQQAMEKAQAFYKAGLEKYKARMQGLPDEKVLRENLWEMWSASDRAGVAKFFHHILPWEVMTPSDTDLWTHYLKTLGTVTFENASFFYRGTNKDYPEQRPSFKLFGNNRDATMQFSWPLRQFINGDISLWDFVGATEPSDWKALASSTGFVHNLLIRTNTHSQGVAANSKTSGSIWVSVSNRPLNTFTKDNDDTIRSGVVKVWMIPTELAAAPDEYRPFKGENEQLILLGMFPDSYIGTARSSYLPQEIHKETEALIEDAKAKGRVPQKLVEARISMHYGHNMRDFLKKITVLPSGGTCDKAL